MDISAVEGEALNSVTFVQDYLQLDFDGPRFTFFQWPEVFLEAGSKLPEGSYAFGDPGYRDVLCSLIEAEVESTSAEEGVALEIKFDNGAIVRVSLREEELQGPEAGQFFSGEEGDSLVVF